MDPISQEDDGYKTQDENEDATDYKSDDSWDDEPLLSMTTKRKSSSPLEKSKKIRLTPPHDNLFLSQPVTQNAEANRPTSQPKSQQELIEILSDDDNDDIVEITTPPPSITQSTTNSQQESNLFAQFDSQEPSQPIDKLSSQNVHVNTFEQPSNHNQCPICLEAWTSTGLHQVCCLQCGHLFGKKCIEYWLSKKKSCPKCLGKAHPTHIRLLFIDNIAVVDNSRVENIQEQLRKEIEKRKEFETKQMHTNLQIKLLEEETKKLKQKTKEQEDTIHVLRNTVSMQTPQKQNGYNQNKQVTTPNKNHTTSVIQSPSNAMGPRSANDKRLIGHQTLVRSTSSPPMQRAPVRTRVCDFIQISTIATTNGRVFDYGNTEQSVFVSFEERNAACGVYKVDMNNPAKRCKISIHNSTIRDVQHCPDQGIILTASIDKQLRLTDTKTQKAAMNYQLPGMAWACAWRSDDTNYCFCGLDDGTLMVYDLRQTRTCLSTSKADAPQGVKPSISSLQYITSDDETVRGILASSLGGGTLFFNQNDAYKKSLILPGVSASVSFESLTGLCMSTQRSTETSPASHYLFTLQESNRKVSLYDGFRSVVGFQNDRTLSRSTLFMSTRNALVASGDDATGQVLIWDTNTSQVVQHLSAPKDEKLGAIYDVRYKDYMLGVMTTTGLVLYRDDVD